MKIERQFLLVIAASVFMGASLYAHAQERSAVQKTPDSGTNAHILTMSGTVTDTADKPIEGATVEYWRYQGNIFQARDPELKKQAITGADGGFKFEVTNDSIGFLVARKPGLASTWLQMNQAFNTGLEKEQKLVLTPPGTLAGTVVDESDKPVANAEVSIAMALINEPRADGSRTFNYLAGKPLRESFSARTDASGHFKIDNFPTNASAGFAVKAPGKVLRPEKRDMSGPETAGYRVGDRDIKLVVEPACTIEGKIIAGETNQPLPIARLILQPDQPINFMMEGIEPTLSGADGAFAINDVLAGSYRVMAVFGTNTPADWVAESVPVSVDVGQTRRGVEVKPTRGGLLEVAVLGKTDRKPLSGFNVSAYTQTFQSTATSASNGVVRMRLVPGEYRINAYHPTAAGNQTSASVEADKTNRVEIEITPPQKITGIVRAPDGKPAPDVSVRLVGSYGPRAGNAKTGADGRFVLELNQQRFGQNNETTCLLVRDTEHNLAVAEDLEEDATNLDLKLASALTLVGRAQCDGKPITNATATLIFWHGRSGSWLSDLTLTNKPGQFEIPALPPGRKYGVVVTAPGYGQKSVFDIGASADAIRQELDTVDLSLANMKLAGQVVDADDKPVAGCNVNIRGEGQPSANARTDRDGRFVFEHVCEGSVQLSANSQQSYGNVSAEGGDTNVVLRLGQTYSSSSGTKTHKLTGVVTDADGKPAAGAQVAVFPVNNGLRWFKTDTNGTYSLNWALESWQTQSGSAILVVRDTARNLAVTAELTEDITNLNVQMKPALTITGQVKSVDDAPLTDAQIDVQIRAGGSGSYNRLNEQLTNARADGHFELGLLPADAKYFIFVSAKNHGRGQIQIEPDPEALRMELPTFVLKIADRVIAGQVLNEKEKPVSGANVSLNGENQPDGNMMTDSKGRFHFQVCEGSIRLFASSQSGYANATAESGDTNIVIVLGSNSGGSRQPPPRSALKGNPLPDLASVNLAADAAPADKPVLLCLFDAGQRPSRFFIRQLNEKSPALQQKNVSVVGVQAAVTSDETFNDWKNASPVSFPIGRVTEKTDKSKWASSVNTFPWLILTDARHQVIAEGFSFDELDAQIAKLAK